MYAFKPHLLLLLGSLAVLATGCSSFSGLDSRIVPPTLIEKAPLPQPPVAVAGRDFYLRMEILVGKDGAVRHVTLTKSSGDPEWDAVAVERIMEWKFSPALMDDKPIQMRIIQTARVVTSTPIMMDLSELVCMSFAKADSAYSFLREGASFDSIASVYSCKEVSMSVGHIGEIDINRYPEDVQSELHNLKRGSFTQPLPLGPYFAIFMKH